MPIHVYRVLQESLNNLARHSRSISAWVRVRFRMDRWNWKWRTGASGWNWRDQASREGWE